MVHLGLLLVELSSNTIEVEVSCSWGPGVIKAYDLSILF